MTFWHEFSLAATGLAEPAWLRLVGLLAATWAGIWALRPVATLLHELGHAIPALFFTSEVVELQVGKDAQKHRSGEVGEKVKETVIWRSLGRLRWTCSFRGSFQGFTG